MKTSSNGRQFKALLYYLKTSRGFDYSAYKESTLKRRIAKRLEQVRCKTYEDYLDYLQVHPDESAHLLNTILINITAFFRDPPFWDLLAKQVIPRLAKAKGSPNIRVWSAGCASGEEPYTLAIVLAKALGPEAFHRRVKIYATDIDDAALTEARRASYHVKAFKGVPRALRVKYFDQNAGRYVVRGDLRRAVIFGRANMVSDPPITHLDLLLCRNTLMYFTRETQAQLLSRFAFALKDDGVLAVGKAEMVLLHDDRFIPFNQKFRIFRKAPEARNAGIRLIPALAGRQKAAAPLIAPPPPVVEGLSGIGSIAQVQLDTKGRVTQFNERAKALLGLGDASVGHLFQRLKPVEKTLELRTQVERVYKQRRTALIRNVRCQTPSGELQDFDVEVVPLVGPKGKTRSASIFFYDVTRVSALKAEHGRSVQDLETAYEELQASHEELQSTNEELETTNEELQSANEELETMNEELQSSNEELRAANDQGQRQAQETDKVSSFLKSVLGSMNMGVVVVGPDYNVKVWNQKSEDLWGLRSEEACGQHVMNLDIGLPVGRLKDSIRASLAGDNSVPAMVLDASNRRGKPLQCRVTFSPLKDEGRGGCIVFMEEVHT